MWETCAQTLNHARKKANAESLAIKSASSRWIWSSRMFRSYFQMRCQIITCHKPLKCPEVGRSKTYSLWNVQTTLDWFCVEFYDSAHKIARRKITTDASFLSNGDWREFHASSPARPDYRLNIVVSGFQYQKAPYLGTMRIIIDFGNWTWCMLVDQSRKME